MIHGFRKETPMILDQFWLTEAQFLGSSGFLVGKMRGMI
jgi:hypothetical protein